ncbi:MAG: TonB-dependent receptor [Rhodanobacteraceae bacterium]|jgi:outer membrane receptor protein involved in Fe transport|nr:TonB-dependent receptor [Rhodanobacteraceae bacterium]
MIPDGFAAGWRAACALWLSAGASGALAAAAPDAEPLPTVTVVGTTPLATIEDLPAPAQVASAADLERSHAIELTDYLKRALGGVFVNDIAGNPFQPDLSYRGYTASPLLGTAQGLSVYFDGMRLNQPFGDVVSWDLIPTAAIARMALMPGSNPLFGLNTLGGALVIRSKDGYANPGSAVQAWYGSNARRDVQFETGGHDERGVHWYFTGHDFREDGWREHSPSRVDQFFGKVGWRGAGTELALSGAYADTDLNGNGLQEQRFLARDHASVYTWPDNTKNRTGLLNLTATHAFGDAASFSGNAYLRDIQTRTFNGDINDESLGESLYQPNAAERAALAAAGYGGFPDSGENATNTPFPFWRCIANALLDEEPNEKCNGLLGRTRTSQREAGASGQFTFGGELVGRANEFTLGAAWSGNRTHFQQSAQFGYLTPDRGVAPVDAWADGTQDSENAFDARVNLKGRAHTASLYATDTWALAERWSLTLSGRYDRSTVHNRDALTPGGGPGPLDGDHRYGRFNPALGLAFAPSKAWSAWFGYTEGSRAPSSIELGCADPDNPCRLPNSMAGDPPLKQVVAKTLDAGLRGAIGADVNWRASVFRATNHDDILFVASSASGYGYFRNFGQTRRQGIELGLDGRVGRMRYGANYTLLDATYRTVERVNGAGNSSNDAPAPGFEGSIEIHPGDRIPLIPRQVIKAFASIELTRRIALDADMLAVGGAYARGNENNLHQPDGIHYLGPGRSGGYAVFNLGADYRPTPRLKLFAQVDNLFDRRYASGAQLGATGFDAAGRFVARPFSGPVVDGERPLVHATFYAPGAPRLFWLGLRYTFAP